MDYYNKIPITETYGPAKRKGKIILEDTSAEVMLSARWKNGAALSLVNQCVIFCSIESLLEYFFSSRSKKLVSCFLPTAGKDSLVGIHREEAK
jgi:hypothetical protein